MKSRYIIGKSNKSVPQSFQKINWLYKGVLAFALPVLGLLLSLLGFFSGERRLRRQKIADLQVENRLLYSGNTHLPQIVLTFDDGPHPTYTPQVLAILQRYGVKATFFCVGQSVLAYPDIVKEAYAAGHEIANHSWSHPNMTLIFRSRIVTELTCASEAIEQVIGARPISFRPPYGAFSSQVLKQAYHLGLTTVIWNIRATDWAKPGVDVIASRILNRSVHGGIILLHDGGGDRSETVAALPAIIEGLQQRGFAFVTLEQMVTHLDATSPIVTGEKDPPWKDLCIQLLTRYLSLRVMLKKYHSNEERYI